MINETINTSLWNKKDLEKALHSNITADITNVTAVSIDTRSLKSGDIFFAIKGDNFDGHDFVSEAIKLGATLCVVEKEISVCPEYENKLLKVKSVSESLNKLGEYRRKALDAKVICITGSLGKTTTKNMLHSVLKEYGKTHSTSKNFNNHYGVPLTLANTPLDTDYCVLELGMNHSGEIDIISKIAKPDIAIITNVHNVHMEFFHSIEGIAKAKAEIIPNITKNGKLIAHKNIVNEAIFQKLAKENDVEVFWFGDQKNEDCFIENYNNNDYKIDCCKKIVNQKFHPDLGKHLAFNALSIFLCLSLLKIKDLKKAQEILTKIKPSSGRGEIIDLPNNISVIDESYNSSPKALESAIKNLIARKKEGGRSVAILGDMKELGKDEINIHKSIQISQIDKLFSVGHLMQSLYEEVDKKVQGIKTNTSEELAKSILTYIKKNDTILVKGSYSMRMWKIIEILKTGGLQ
ncbi:MAG: UDP-N-acetylmuramoyl-tripeptide--D-alanyl-D-alanine ligase [Candidatus Midichloriaceae bacterium]